MTAAVDVPETQTHGEACDAAKELIKDEGQEFSFLFSGQGLEGHSGKVRNLLKPPRLLTGKPAANRQPAPRKHASGASAVDLSPSLSTLPSAGQFPTVKNAEKF